MRNYLNTADDCQRQGIAFVPLVGEPSGGWGPSAQCVFKSLAKAIAALSGRTWQAELECHRQALGVLLRQANARAIFRRQPDTSNLSLDDRSALLAMEIA